MWHGAMPVRVPSTTLIEESAQVPNADWSARMSAGQVELTMTKFEVFQAGNARSFKTYDPPYTYYDREFSSAEFRNWK